MANNRVYETDLTIPAGTPISAPVSSVIPLPVGTVGKVTLIFPPGPAGLVGWALLLSGVPIIPYGGAAWIVADDYADSWELDQDVNPGQLSAAGYNLDVSPHTVYLRVLFVTATPPLPVAVSLASSSAAAPDLTGLGSPGPGAATGTATGAAGATTGAGTCYDASGNVVACSDPSAIAGPVTSPVGVSGQPVTSGATASTPGSSSSSPGATTGSPGPSASSPGGTTSSG